MSSIVTTKLWRVCDAPVSKVSQTVPMRAAALAVAALVLAPAAQAGPGIVKGRVTRGPTSPVCHVGSPCTAPARNVMLVFSRAGASVGTRTDRAGSYRISLRPGRWRVALDRTGVGTAIEPREILAVAGRTRVVDLAIDTGIR